MDEIENFDSKFDHEDSPLEIADGTLDRLPGSCFWHLNDRAEYRDGVRVACLTFNSAKTTRKSGFLAAIKSLKLKFKTLNTLNAGHD